jgi:hypothetical protein
MILILLTHLAFAKANKPPVIVEQPPVITSGQGDLEFVPVKNYATTQEAKIIVEAGKKVNEVVQGECLADLLKARKMIQTKGQTSAQVVAHIQSLKGKVPVVMYYRRFGSAIAYREPPSTTINLNRRAFNSSLSVCDWASTMLHEASHAIGEYDHDYKWNASRDYSVPYSLNVAVEKCCK